MIIVAGNIRFEYAIRCAAAVCNFTSKSDIFIKFARRFFACYCLAMPALRYLVNSYRVQE